MKKNIFKNFVFGVVCFGFVFGVSGVVLGQTTSEEDYCFCNLKIESTSNSQISCNKSTQTYLNIPNSNTSIQQSVESLLRTCYSGESDQAQVEYQSIRIPDILGQNECPYYGDGAVYEFRIGSGPGTTVYQKVTVSCDVKIADTLYQPDDSSPQEVSQEPQGTYNLSGVKSLNKLGTTSIPNLIGSAIKAVLGFVGVIALLMFLYAGILWMTSAGNSERQQKAKDILVWSTLGIIIILTSASLVSFVLQVF